MNQEKLIRKLEKIQDKINNGDFGYDEAVVLIAELENGNTSIHAIKGDNATISDAVLITAKVLLTGYKGLERDCVKEYLIQEIQKM